MMKKDVASVISGIDWDKFDKFTLLGDLASVVDTVGNSNCPGSLVKLGAISAFFKSNRQRPPRLLYVYLLLAVSDTRPEGTINSEELIAFYSCFFHSGVKETNMKVFFSQHATLMVVRHAYYKPTKFHTDIVGAITLLRPRD